MKLEQVIGVTAASSLAVTVLGQAAVCCIPSVSFPPPKKGSACSGSETTVCDEPPIFTESGNRVGSLRDAVCQVFSTGSLGSFVQDDCSFDPDPSWTFIGNMGNGICCSIDTAIFPAPAVTPLGHKIRRCESGCDIK